MKFNTKEEIDKALEDICKRNIDHDLMEWAYNLLYDELRIIRQTLPCEADLEILPEIITLANQYSMKKNGKPTETVEWVEYGFWGGEPSGIKFCQTLPETLEWLRSHV